MLTIQHLIFYAVFIAFAWAFYRLLDVYYLSGFDLAFEEFSAKHWEQLKYTSPRYHFHQWLCFLWAVLVVCGIASGMLFTSLFGPLL